MSTSAPVGRRRRRPLPDGPTPESAAAQSEPSDPESVARSIVLRKLTMAPATRAQLAELLASRGIPDDVSLPVLDRFEEVGLINDAEYASLWVQSRRRDRGLSRRALRAELVKRGVSRDTIDECLEGVTPDDERAAARALVLGKLRSTARLERQARVRRLVGLLARRGYSSSMALAVVLEAVGESESVHGAELDDEDEDF